MTSDGTFTVMSKPGSLFADNQKLRDSAGRESAADTMAAMSLNSGGNTMVIDLNPGPSTD
jgi:hypothetical protein